ncbi:MAG TPA: hypothetical protein PLP19_06625 [bacterium]|nr:hypothetical protein [bacterium]HPN43144.1 hypothetical protein [bacterium]
MKHTYILQEGIWHASGRFYDEFENCFTLEAVTQTTHTEDEWIHEGTMIIHSPQPLEISNKYEIIPLMKNNNFTNWVQFNPTLGIITGKFMILENTILSSYRSETGEYTGTEVLIQMNSEKYINRGFAFRGNERLSCWTAELHKQN